MDIEVERVKETDRTAEDGESQKPKSPNGVA